MLDIFIKIRRLGIEMLLQPVTAAFQTVKQEVKWRNDVVSAGLGFIHKRVFAGKHDVASEVLFPVLRDVAAVRIFKTECQPVVDQIDLGAFGRTVVAVRD